MPNIIGVGQLSLLDMNDILISQTPPLHPEIGTPWIDSNSDTLLFKEWNGTTWVVKGEIPEVGIGETVETIILTLGSMANDNKIDNKERKIIKEKLSEIIGRIPLNTDTTLPTVSSMDVENYNAGTFHNVRKSARLAGISTTDADYVRVATAYNALKVYLEGHTIRSWNTSSETDVITVVKDTFRQRWLDYYTAVEQLATRTSKQLKDNTDNLQQSISFKVSKDDIINSINLTPELISIDGSKININGNTVFTNTRDKVSNWSHSNNTTMIDGGKIYTNSITSNQISVGELSAITAHLGTITSGTVTGATIQTSATANRGVKLNSTGLIGYNSSGIQTFSLNASTGLLTANGGNFIGGTVTGATIQTSSNVNRGVKLDSTGLIGYDSSGIQTFSLNASTGLLTARGGNFIDGNITGANITTSEDITVGNNIKMGQGDDDMPKMIRFGSVNSFWSNHYISAERDILEISSSWDLTIFAYSSMTISGGIGTLDVVSYDTVMIESERDEVRLKSQMSLLRVHSQNNGVYIRSSGNGGYHPINASSFNVNSRRQDKKNIVPFSCPLGHTAIQKVLSTPVYNYHYNEELDLDLKHTGVIIDEAPLELIDPYGDGVDVYSMVSVLWKAFQEQQEIINDLNDRIELLN